MFQKSLGKQNSKNQEKTRSVWSQFLSIHFGD